MRDEEDRPFDASSAAGTGRSGSAEPDASWADATAPDDISELSADVAAYHRELRAARRRQRVGRLVPQSALGSLSLTLAALAVIALAATFLTVMAPRSHELDAPQPVPLALSSRPLGTQGGVLPAVTLTSAARVPANAQDLRPAVIALLPHPCGCDGLLLQAASDASHDGVPMYAVTSSQADADAIAGRLVRSDAVLVDPAATLRRDARATGVTLLLVDRTGRIERVARDVAATSLPTLGAGFAALPGEAATAG